MEKIKNLSTKNKAILADKTSEYRIVVLIKYLKWLLKDELNSRLIIFVAIVLAK